MTNTKISVLFSLPILFSLGCQADCLDNEIGDFFNQCSSIGGTEKKDFTPAKPEVLNPPPTCLTCDDVSACSEIGYKEVCGGLETLQGIVCDSNSKSITSTGCVAYDKKVYCYSDNCDPQTTSLCDIIPTGCPNLDFSKICGTFDQCPIGTF